MCTCYASNPSEFGRKIAKRISVLGNGQKEWVLNRFSAEYKAEETLSTYFATFHQCILMSATCPMVAQLGPDGRPMIKSPLHKIIPPHAEWSSLSCDDKAFVALQSFMEVFFGAKSKEYIERSVRALKL